MTAGVTRPICAHDVGEDVIVRKIDFEFFDYGDISDYSVATARIKEAVNPNPTSKSAVRVRSRGGGTLEFKDAKPLTEFPLASAPTSAPAPGASSATPATSNDIWGLHQSMTTTFSAERDRALNSEREIAAKALVADRALAAAALATEREHSAKAVEQALDPTLYWVLHRDRLLPPRHRRRVYR